MLEQTVSARVEEILRSLNQCVFCLENVSISRQDSGQDSEKLSVTEFNNVWSHLTRRKGGSQEDQVFQISPPTCQNCDKVVHQLSNLLEVIKNVENSIKNIVDGAGRHGQSVKFIKHLKNSGAEGDHVIETVQVLGRLGHSLRPSKDEFLDCHPVGQSKGDSDNNGETDDDDRMSLGGDDDSPIIDIDEVKIEAGEEDVQIATGSENEDDNESGAEQPFTSPSGKKRRKHVRRIWICDVCREKVSNQDMAQHVRDHVGDYALACPNPNCVFLYSTILHFKFHIFRRNSSCKTFFTNDPFQSCEVCGYQAAHQGLRSHLLMVHETGDSKPYPCPVSGCSEVFAHRQTVYFHISHRHCAPKLKAKLVSSSTSQTCPACLKEFSHEDMPQHIVDIHGISKESIISCNYCPFKSLTRLQLLDHLLIHFRHGIPVSCDLCPDPLNYSRLDSLRRHCYEAHQVGQLLTCDHCGNTFLLKEQLKIHLRRFHSDRPQEIRQKKFKCSDCPEDSTKYASNNELMSHKINFHGAEPYKCSSCEKTFTSWQGLRIHGRSHKNTLRTYVCDLPGCGKICKSSTDLATHKRSVKHVGKTNAVVCDECGMGFNDESRIRRHKLEVHSDERKFVCDICGKGFKTKRDLVSHVRVHSDERPVGCPLCHKRFRRKHDQKIHMKTHAKNKTKKT